MIGKTILDSIGWTKKLGGITQPKIEPIIKMNSTRFNEFKAYLDNIEKDPVQVDLYLKAHGLEQVEGLKDYILNNNIQQGSINELITQQNYQNIANQAHGFVGVNTAIEEYNKLTDEASKSKLAETIGGTNAKLGAYLTNVKSANANIYGYAGSLVVATAKTLALQAATMAMNAAISFGISFLIQGLVSVVTNLINQVENTKQAVDDMISSYENAQSTLKSHKNTIDELKDRYIELSKGVNESGQNIALTADEYEEYNNIVNRIAEMYPKLVAGHTSEGNALLTLRGNVEALTQAYRDEQKAAAAAIISGDDSANAVKNYSNSKTSSFKQAWDAAWTWDTNKATVKVLTTQQKIEYLNKALSMSTDALTAYSGSIGNDNTFRSVLRTYGIDSKSTDEEVNSAIETMKADLSTYEAELEESLSGIRTKANAYLVFNDNYENLSDSQLSAIQSLINNIDTTVADSFKNDSDISSYVSKLIEGIGNNKDGIATAYQKLLDIDLNSPENINNVKSETDKYVKQIADYTGQSIETIKKTLGVDNVDLLYEQYNEAIKRTKESFSDLDVETLFNDNAINSSSKLTLWNKIITSSENAGKSIEDLLLIYKNAAKKIKTGATVDTNIFELGDEAKTNLGKLSEEIDNIQSAYSALSSAIVEYNSQGSFSIDTIQSVLALGDDWLDYLIDENGALKLDEEALENLTKARIEGMKQQSLATLASNVSNIQNEADALEYLSSTNYDAATSYQTLTQAKMADIEASLASKLENGDISQDTYDKVIEKFKSDAAKIQKIFDNTDFTLNSDGISQSSIENLENHAKILKTVKEEYESTGRISYSTLSSVAKAYPEITSALDDYKLGLISSEELFSQLEKCYENDKNNHIQSLKNKAEVNETYFASIRQQYPEVFKTLQELYGNDVDNWKSVAKAKTEIDSKLLQQLSGKWANYFKAIKGIDGKYDLVSYNFDDSDIALTNPGTADELHSEYEEFKKLSQKYVNDANTALDALDKITFKPKDNFDWDSLIDSSSSSSSTAKSYDLIERAVENLRRKMTSLKNTTDDTFASWSDRNEALINQIQTTTEQIELQQKAYDKYMQLANSTGLSDYYKGLIQNGAIDEITISDKVRQEQIDSYKDYYDKAIAASEAVDELKSSLNELEKSKMDIISNEINKVKEQITSAINLIDGYIELAETSGLFASEDLYKQLIENYQKYLSNLYTEREKLNNQFEASVISGKIKEGNESWYNMQSQINEVNEAILDTIVNIKDMSNQLMNLNFEKFEYMQGKIENLASEADFYLNLIESMDKALYDKNGSFTAEGITTVGLHAQNLNTYLQQADDYAKKLAEIEKEIANDTLNNDLTDKKQEYIEAQREAVLSAQDERNAIADLVKDGYDKQIDSLSDLIDKYKNLMSAQKDAYDYEKQMTEKAETLASLKKQYEAWKGDISEEGMKVRQELEVQIKDAQKDIQESEYDKLISDTEKLLDNLQDEYETLINERIDNIDSELQNITSSVNESASIIAGVLEELSNDTGLPLTDAMLNIWNDAQPVADINSSVENVNDTLSGTNEAIQGLRDDVQKIFSQMDKAIEDTKATIANGNANNTDNNGNSGSNNSSGSTPFSPANGSNSSNSLNGSATSNNSSNSSNSHDWSIYKHYSPQKLNTDTSVVDRLKSNNIDASFEARSQYWDKLIGEGTYKSTYDQNVKLLNWLKNNGYANGTKSAAKGWHLFDENALGSEVILTKQGVLKQFEGGEHVFDANATKNLWKLAQINPDRLIPDLKLNTSLPEMANRNAYGNVNYSCGDVSFVLPNVKNYEDIMKQAQNDRRFEKMVQEMTLGETFGHNSFKKLQY